MNLPKLTELRLDTRVTEIEKRAVEVIADTVGDTVTPAVTALLATAAVVTHNPALGVLSVPTGALAGALSKQGTQLVIETLRDRAQRVQALADAIEEETGEPAEDFISGHVDDGEKRALLGHIVDAATDAKTSWKIHLLAKAFVRGLDNAELIDETLYFVEVLRGLEPPHARFMRAMQAVIDAGEGSKMQNHEVLSKDNGLGPSLPFLRRRLAELEIIEVTGKNSDGPQFELTDLGTACAEWLGNLGEESIENVADRKGTS